MGLPDDCSAPRCTILNKGSAVKSEKKQMLRLAVAIREQYVKRTAPPVTLPVAEWEYLCNKMRRVQLAKTRRLWLAAVKLKEESVSSLQRLRDEMTAVLAADVDARSKQTPPSASEIYQDLASLREEFDEVSWSLRERTLSATTEPIVLEDMYLGAFQIELHWANLPDDSAYSVIAVDPKPAASNDSVTHPHVEDGVLCAGDGRVPIRRALAEGRLADFFLIVANILRTYNVDSAYVTLGAWDGRPCVDCGSHLADDEGVSCSRCASLVCDDCCVFCSGCLSSYCSECTTGCSACDARYCIDCLCECPSCKRLVCRNCLHERDCEYCHDEETENDAFPSDGANRLCRTAVAV
jgi:hypothetical protein